MEISIIKLTKNICSFVKEKILYQREGEAFVKQEDKVSNGICGKFDGRI